MPITPLIAPFSDFEAASRATLAYLHQQFGFDLWMTTRTEGNDWILLQIEDHGYGITEGSVLNWQDSFCARMIQGDGPSIAPNAMGVPAYQSAPINQILEIGAYIGIPLHRSDGSLFGTLCAISTQPQPDYLVQHLPTLTLLGQFLSTVLEHDLQSLQQQNELAEMQEHAMTDSLTGISNRRAWEQRLQTEEARAKRFGSPVSVLILDIDGLKELNDEEGHSAGDDLLKRTAQILKTSVRQSDLVARIGGDEFGILAFECDRCAASHLAQKIAHQLLQENISASIGFSQRDHSLGLEHAVLRADQLMYEEKSRHHENDS